MDELDKIIRSFGLNTSESISKLKVRILVDAIERMAIELDQEGQLTPEERTKFKALLNLDNPNKIAVQELFSTPGRQNRLKQAIFSVLDTIEA